MTSTDIVPSGLRELVASGKLDLTELMTRLAAPKLDEAEAKQAAPAPKEIPKSIVLSVADKKALRTLPVQLAEVKLPDKPRVLTDTEIDTLVPLFDKVKVAKKAVTKAEDAIKEAMHGHIDSTTEDATRDKNGHKLIEGEVASAEYSKKVVRGLTGGGAVSLTVDDLRAMVEARQITQAQFIRMTEVVPATRKIVPDAVMVEIRKHADLLDVLAVKAQPVARSSAVRMADNT